MSSDNGDDIGSGIGEESAGVASEVPEAPYEASPEYEGDPQELWIEEYEREGRRPKPKKEREKPRRIGRWIFLGAVIVILVVWTLISPSIMSVSGTVYVGDEEYANLGSETVGQDVQVIASIVTAGTTTWGVSIGGEANATVDDDAVFEVIVSKVSEERGGFWFMGTDISLRNVSMYLDDDTLIGWMVEKQELGNRSVGTVRPSGAPPSA